MDGWMNGWGRRRRRKGRRKLEEEEVKGKSEERGERDLVSLDEVPGPQDVHLEHAVNCWHSVLL